MSEKKKANDKPNKKEEKDIKNEDENYFFDYVVGNPPYQETKEDTSDKPIYHLFMKISYALSKKVMLITPARFLFGAGKVPKDFVNERLNDEHFRVVKCEMDSKKIFPDVDIPGGVAITYRDEEAQGEAIETFVPIPELKEILKEVKAKQDQTQMGYLIDDTNSAEWYKFSDEFVKTYPKFFTAKKGEKPLISKGHSKDLVTNIFDKLKGKHVFFEKKPNKKKYIKVLGRLDNKRKWMYIDRSLMEERPELDKFKVFIPKGHGCPALGSGTPTEMIGEILVAKKGTAHTQTFIGIGKFDEEEEAKNLEKYLKTKFARAMLGILKVTQLNQKPVWKYVPKLDFSTSNDMWKKSIEEIDKDLYKYFGLTEDMIKVIEDNIKKMD